MDIERRARRWLGRWWIGSSASRWVGWCITTSSRELLWARVVFYVFPYHETGLLKWLPANEGCPAKSEVLLVGFWARVYCDKLAVSLWKNSTIIHGQVVT